LCCLSSSFGYFVVSPSSFGYCVFWPSSFSYCVVCPSSFGYCVFCPSFCCCFFCPFFFYFEDVYLRNNYISSLDRNCMVVHNGLMNILTSMFHSSKI
jgi:hypothetical protein